MRSICHFATCKFTNLKQKITASQILGTPLLSDINHSSVVSFADDTRVYRQINDCDCLQYDLDNVYTWPTTNNMVFNDGKFQHISYHHQSKHRSENHIYLSPSLNIINSQQHIKDLAVTMSSDCSFYEHIDLKIKQCRHLTSWILCTFKARDKSTMLTLFKSLVLPRLEYGCQLCCPATVNQIRAMESIQRKFTKHIDGLYSLSYKERLIGLHMYSLQRRRERYAAIYVWKILEDMVPNLSPPIAGNLSERRGCVFVLNVVEWGHIGSLAYNSFRWRVSRIFNALPPAVRNMSKCGVNVFNSLVSTGDTGRQPPLLPPLRAAISVDTIIHNYRLSTPP